MAPEWKIEEQPTDYQIRYWRLRAEKAEHDLHNKRLWHTPPERTAFEALEKELRDTRQIVAHLRADSDVWKKIGLDAQNRVVELEAEGAAAILKRERDHWRDSWRNCTRRLADKIEHLGLDHTGVEPNADQP